MLGVRPTCILIRLSNLTMFMQVHMPGCWFMDVLGQRGLSGLALPTGWTCQPKGENTLRTLFVPLMFPGAVCLFTCAFLGFL